MTYLELSFALASSRHLLLLVCPTLTDRADLAELVEPLFKLLLACCIGLALAEPFLSPISPLVIARLERDPPRKPS